MRAAPGLRAEPLTPPPPAIEAAAPAPAGDDAAETVASSMESFEILKLLGKGAYGRALLCRDVRHPDDGDDETALVVVKQVTSLDAAQVLEATKEARILGRLDHPNVVAFYESFTEHSVVEGAVLSIVMEFCDGGDLDGAIKRRKASGAPFGEAYVMRVFVQLLVALKYVHGLRILHRDIKPQNIFLTKSGLAKWGDFGVARSLAHSSSMARTQTGTPYYLSPEIFNDESYDAASDMWSFGVVLFELATLKLPFTAGSLGKLATVVLRGSPPVPHHASDDLKDLIGRLLCKRAAHRPSAKRLLRSSFVRDHARRLLDHTAATGTGGLEAPPPRAPAGDSE